MGQAFIDSEEFRSYTGHGQSGRFEIEGYLETRAAITTASLAIPHFVIQPIETTFRSQLLEVVGKVTVSAGVVDWVEIGADPVAAVVAEGSAKPEATFTMTPQTAALETIAHWVQITRQALEDAPYIRSLIEGKLRRGLLAKAEADMAAALVAATLPTATGADMSKSIRVGIGKVEAAGYNPNAVVLNPTDYATLDIAVGVGRQPRPGTSLDVLGSAGRCRRRRSPPGRRSSATSRRGPPCSTVASPTCSSPTRMRRCSSRTSW